MNTPSTTHTGHFRIGFRRVRSEWQRTVEGLARWATENNFAAVDVGPKSAAEIPPLEQAGLAIGSIDLLEGFGDMLSAEKSTRDAAVARAVRNIEECAASTPRNFFTVMVPENPGLPRRENFQHMIASYSELVPALEKTGSRIVVEGWPGPGALCCTPETYRALIREISSPAIGINYDPSHLIRMGIDPIRFLREFVDRVYHVHAKDTAISDDGIYEFGWEQPVTFAAPVPFGTSTWRYTIPGHGRMNWFEGFPILAGAGYSGCVSIELEDANFNGSEEGEKRGFIQSRQFLEGC